MDTTSPKMDTDDGATATKTTPISANGKKLVQARLPFKTLADAVKPSVTIEKRKRKLSKTDSIDDERAPKLNRIDGSVVDKDLLSTEILDESVEYTLTDRKSIGKSEVKSMKSESKENVNTNERKGNNVDDHDDDVMELDESSGGGLSDDVELVEPKARKCLDMNTDAKQPKRANDEQLITIKLPMPKKPKEASKKAKKADKAKADKGSVMEIILCDDTDDDKHADAVQGRENNAEMNASNEAMDSTTSDDQLMLTPVSDKGMTPKQAARRAESEKKLLEKQKAKEQRELDRQREKEEKELQRKQEREAKEAQRKREKEAKEQKRLAEQEEREMKKKAEAEEKEKKKQAEAEEKEKKRLAEIEARNEERRKRDEQKEEERRKREELKEEERKCREEEKRQRDEAEANRNRREAAVFANYFKVKPKVTVSEAPETGALTQSHQFMSFEIKGAMKVAAVTRRQLLPQERADLEGALSASVEKDELYLKKLKTGKHVARQSGKTWSVIDDEAQSEVEDELFLLDSSGAQMQVIDDKSKKQIYRAKFFRFHENRRPPFHGTWRKKSQIVGPRRPFIQDKKFFDYEVDSDDEWEEEEQVDSESLYGSDDEKDAEPEDDYVIDGFFVPHGHLSDEELNGEDEMDEESSLETQQAKLKYIQEAFDKEIHKKTHKLKPRVIGLIWQKQDRSQPDTCTKATWDLLRANAFMMVGETLSMAPPTANDENSSGDDDADSAKNATKRKLKISEREVPNLIRLINGNQNNHAFLNQEFRAFIAKTQMPQREYSILSIRKKIKELGVYGICPEEGPMQNKMCWYVPIETRKQYGLGDLTMPNSWEYILTPPRAVIDTGNSSAVVNDAEKDEKEKKGKSLKDKQKERARRDSDADSDDVMYLSDSNSCVLSETVTSESVKQASLKPANFNIAKFIKPLSKDEKIKQFGPLTLYPSNEPDGAGPSQSLPVTVEAKKSDTTSKPIPVKKRVKLLASGPIGQDLSKSRENILTKFVIQRPSPADSASVERPKSTETAKPAADVIVID